jgi:hypothetical protein
MQTRKPRRYYALCLGTVPKHQAYQIRRLFKKSSSCNVEFRFRGRGKNRKKKHFGNLLISAYEEMPLSKAKHVAIYVSIKRSLLKMMDAAKVRDKMLKYANRKEKEE